MTTHSSASRQRYIDYQVRLKRGESSLGPGTSKKRRRRRSFKQLFGLFWELLAGHRVMFIVALLILSLGTLVSLTLPASAKIALDYVLVSDPDWPAYTPDWITGQEQSTLLWTLSGAMIVVTMVTVTIGIWGRWQTTRLTKRLQVKLRRQVYEHAVRLPMHRIHELKSGGVASILREDAGGAAELLFSMMYNPWRAVVQLTATLLILGFVDWQLLIGAVLILPIIFVSHRTWIARLRPLYRDIRQTRTSVDAHATETFGGMRVVRGFGREQGEAARFVRETDYMIRQEILAWWWSRGIEVVWQLMVPFASAALLIYGGSRILNGTMTFGDLMMFSAYLLMLLGPLEALAASATRIQSNLAGYDRILDLLDEPREFADSVGKQRVNPQTARGRIEIDSLWFAYPTLSASPGSIGTDENRNQQVDESESPLNNGSSSPRPPRWVLQDINLTIEPGQTIAIVGPSGSGKTTLCNLIARLYDPQRGSIRFDGVDLRDIEIASFRSLLGIVEQDVFLFDGTILQNISYGRRGCSRDEVVEAAKAANAHSFIIDLESGYDELIGERGVRLSGGQKQRIAIARAILADPTILILDEATSSLDTESEMLIQQSLARLMKNRTSFVIAHRLSTVRHADRIVVVEDGQILETGSHDELLAHDGRYAEFLKMQLGTHEAAKDAEKLAGTK